MKHNVKMIVTDLDGTLLRTDKTISEHTKTILNRCCKTGIKIAYVTGRGGSAERVAPNEIFDGRISMNGAIGKIKNYIIYDRLIPYEKARPILTDCNSRGMKITSEISGMHYSNFVVSDIWPQIKNYEIVDFTQHDMNAEKIYTPNPTPDDKLFIEQRLPDDLYFVVTADGAGYLGQIMHKDATKAKAVSALAQHWGISQSEIVVFGDDLNDIDMLTYAGIGVAMGNALDKVKEVSDCVCLRNDDDGVARWIEENIL